MDWPTASVIIGVLGTVATAIVKWPWKHESNGRVYAKAVDMVKVLTKLEGLEQDNIEFKDEMKNLRKTIHDLRGDWHNFVLGRAARERRPDMGS